MNTHTGAGKLQEGFCRLRSDLGRFFSNSSPVRKHEDGCRGGEDKKRRKEESSHPLFRMEEKKLRGVARHRSLAQSYSVPVQHKRGRGEDGRESNSKRIHPLLVQSKSLPHFSNIKPPLQSGGWKDNGREGDRNTRKFAMEHDNGSETDSHISEHIYEEIQEYKEDEEENESFLLSISPERRNALKFYGWAGWDFQPASY